MNFGLDELTFAELKSSDRLVEVLRKKLRLLDTNRLPDKVLTDRVNLLIEILRDTLLDRYQNLSIRAFAHFAVALDYFLIVFEEGGVPDIHPGGYKDDVQVLVKTCLRFENEILRYKEWKARQPKDDIWNQ